MTTDQMPVAPAEQARELLETAQNSNAYPSASNVTSLNYADALTALRDATVGNGLAMLAVHDELADIATSLRLLAKTPFEIGQLAKHVAAAGQVVKGGLAEVSGEIHDLTATVDQGVEFADSAGSAVHGVSVTVHELTDAVLLLGEPRPPRWWQWRRSRALREAQTTQTDIEA
jgi:hypothetical protein